MSLSTITALDSIPMMLSASLPEDLQDRGGGGELNNLIAPLVRELLRRDGTLVYGGHPTVTPLVHHVAQALQGRGQIILFQAEAFRSTAPEEVWDKSIFRDVHWVGDGASQEDDLQAMRLEMIEQAAAAVFVGGKTTAYTGSKPGIRDEFERFLKNHPDGRVYLLGMLGGEAKRIIEEREIERNPEPNRLTDRERHLLHHTDNVDVAVDLILTDLGRDASGD